MKWRGAGGEDLNSPTATVVKTICMLCASAVSFFFRNNLRNYYLLSPVYQVICISSAL
jgi:hypothetical protein